MTRTQVGVVTVDGQTLTYANLPTIKGGLTINGPTAVNAEAAPDTVDRGPAQVGLTAQERFVQVLYLDALGRPGSKAELDGWAGPLDGSTRAAGGGKRHRGELRSTHAPGEDVVRGVFGAAGVGGGEEQPWVNILLAGQTEEQVLSQVLGDSAGSEFYNRAQGLVASGTADERYVKALYLVLLNRTPSDAEVAGQVAALNGSNRQAVARSFLSGQEFRTDQFEGYYDVLLHRPPDSDGLNGWVFSNIDMRSVRLGFEASSEFFTNG